MDKNVFSRASFPEKMVVNLSEETFAKLRGIAATYKMTLSEAARTIVTDYIRKYEEAHGPVKEADIPPHKKRPQPIPMPSL